MDTSNTIIVAIYVGVSLVMAVSVSFYMGTEFYGRVSEKAPDIFLMSALCFAWPILALALPFILVFKLGQWVTKKRQERQTRLYNERRQRMREVDGIHGFNEPIVK